MAAYPSKAVIPKGERNKSRKPMDAARDEPCILCTVNDGTTVAAHLPTFDNGTGLKGDNRWSVPLCSACHDFQDGRTIEGTKETRLRNWLIAAERKFIQLMEQYDA